MSDWSLRIHVTGEPPREVELTDGLTLGRHPDSDCFLKDPRVSANHAKIVASEDGFSIEDLGSSNKIQVEGAPALESGERAPLRSGQILVLGETRIEVVGPAPDDLAPVDMGATPVESTLIDDEQESSASAASPEQMSGEQAGPADSEASDSATAEDPFVGTVHSSNPPMDDLANAESMRVARPCLVIVDEALGAVHSIGKQRFLIGRNRAHNPDLLIEVDAVSGTHAEITYDGRRFYIRDLGSTNSTFIGEERLMGDSPREIQSDMRLRFGPVEAIFFTDLDPEGRAIPPQRADAALDHLERSGAITAKQRAEARREAKDSETSTAAMLLKTGNLISASAWVKAIEHGRVDRMVASGSSSSWRLLLGTLFLLVVTLAVIFYLVVLR